MMYKKHQAGVYHGKIKKRQRGKKRAGQADAAALRRFGGSVRHDVGKIKGGIRVLYTSL